MLPRTSSPDRRERAVIPIGDADVRRGTTPYVNIGLIAINVLVFLYMLQLGDEDRFIFTYTHGFIPAELTQGLDFMDLRTRFSGTLDIDSPYGNLATMFTSMFLHGGFLHIIGNMLFLWVFGDNIEDRLGHVKYLLFYLGAGLAATWTQVAINPDSQIPMVGASGAIAGVLGAYLLTYPFSRINTLIIFYFITFIRVPALYLLGFWFVWQIFSGWGSLGPQTSSTGGVAYFAHIGGFVAGVMGMAVYKIFTREPLIPRRPADYRWDFRH